MTTPTIIQDEYLVGTDASDNLKAKNETTYTIEVAFPDATTKTSTVVFKDQDFGDVILGLAGDDRIEGVDGHDSLYGGVGNDTIYGGRTVFASDPDILGSSLYGLMVLNTVYEYRLIIEDYGYDLGYYGYDLDSYYGIYISTGRDRLEGGDGNDVLYGGDDDDVLMGQHGDDKLYGGKGVSDLFMNMKRSHSASIILSSGGQDILYGQDGSDEIDGGDGDDQLIGGAGNDLIYGGQGMVAKTNLIYIDSLRFSTQDQYMSGGQDQL